MVNHVLGAYIVFIEGSQKRPESNKTPPARPFSPDPSDKNFEIAILLLQKSENKNSRGRHTPQGPEASVLSYALGGYNLFM